MKAPLRRAFVVFVALVGVGCSRKPTPDDASRVPGPAPTISVAGSGSGAPPASSAAPLPSAAVVDAGTTRTIACESAQCKAPAEKCVKVGDAGAHCIAASASAGNADLDRSCDDGSDCEEGSTCCATTDMVGRTVCRQPDVADGEPCILQACVPGDGAPCPKGLACRDGFCRPSPRERATCGKGTERCPAESPTCAWKDGKASCVAANVASTYACTRKSDCGEGMLCCGVTDPSFFGEGPAPRSICQRSCEAHYLQALCTTDADCPSLFETGMQRGPGTRKCVAHDKSVDEPAWIRHCR